MSSDEAGVSWSPRFWRAKLTRSGTLHIAEVTSRFTSTEAFVEMVESFGFELNTEVRCWDR